MSRVNNIFHNLVTDEDSTTELLCNLSRFSVFRRLVVSQFLSDPVAAQVAYEDINTQVDLGSSGRPDIVIRNDETCAIIEVKVTSYQPLTDKQPDGYFQYLLQERSSERALVFLIPNGWIHRRYLQDCLQRLKGSQGANGVLTRVIYWEDLLDLLEDNQLHKMNPFFAEFHGLLAARYRPVPLTLSASEVVKLFTKEIPNALSKLDQLIAAVREKGGAYKSKLYRTQGLCADEYGIYFMNENDENILWFGVWMDVWKKKGVPLCFGVDDKWAAKIRDAFHRGYKGGTHRVDDWTIGLVSQDVMARGNVVEHIWSEVGPLLQALATAESGKA